MKPSNFLLVSLLLLVPCEVFEKCGPKAVSCDYTPSYDLRKKGFNDENVSKTAYKDESDPLSQESPIPVKVRYNPTPAEKCREGQNVSLKQEELCRQEIEAVKEAAAKYQAKKREQPCKPAQSVKNLDLTKDTCRLPAKRGNVMCAECEECELQVKAGGEGVMLKCTGCRMVPPDEVMFPPGSNRRVVKFP